MRKGSHHFNLLVAAATTTAVVVVAVAVGGIMARSEWRYSRDELVEGTRVEDVVCLFVDEAEKGAVAHAGEVESAQARDLARLRERHTLAQRRHADLLRAQCRIRRHLREIDAEFSTRA